MLITYFLCEKSKYTTVCKKKSTLQEDNGVTMNNTFKRFVNKLHDVLDEEKRRSFHFDTSDHLDSEDGANKNPRNSILQKTFGEDETKMWIALFSDYPTIQNTSGLRIKLDLADDKWMNSFIANGGLESVFNMIESMVFNKKERGLGGSYIDDAITLLETIKCVKSLMKKKIGLESLINNSHLSKKVILGKPMFVIYFFYRFLYKTS